MKQIFNLTLKRSKKCESKSLTKNFNGFRGTHNILSSSHFLSLKNNSSHLKSRNNFSKTTKIIFTIPLLNCSQNSSFSSFQQKSFKRNFFKFPQDNNITIPIKHHITQVQDKLKLKNIHKHSACLFFTRKSCQIISSSGRFNRIDKQKINLFSLQTQNIKNITLFKTKYKNNLNTNSLIFVQYASNEKLNQKNRNSLLWMLVVIILLLAATYAAVPLYRVFCRKTGFGGTVQESPSSNLMAESLLFQTQNQKNLRPITITFDSTVSKDLLWEFVPLQKQVEIIPGNSALVFYKAKNLSDKEVIGVATYNVSPDLAGQYFYKVQCFCFEEQKLLPGEEVDMPILFFLDPKIVEDKALKNVNDIVLSYTFFHSQEDYRY